ncbi:alpha/beta fold hydrolase [Nocardia transvalensis]|uniref:alpha/beta fold hydrolase n=1 Tax=Nocardia transvalensis TaxID=37333 RepID=UPI0018939FE6|nr:alpha/beta hydrolase [Nocardia transvalensis]MBF6331807.1 alpha/beta hydrolase [Nocardia transvalensis]
MYRDHTSITIPVDGAELSASRWGRPSAPATVVYIHGLLSDSSVWTPLIRHLHEHLDAGIAQIAFDQRGYSPARQRIPCRGIEISDLAEDLDTVLTHACGATIVAAHSTGSLLVQAWAERYPHHAAAVAGMVLFGAAAEFPEFPCLPAHYRSCLRRLRSREMGAGAVEPAIGALLLRRYFRRRTCFGPTDSALIAGMRRTDRRAMTALFQAYNTYQLTEPVTELLRGIPTFVVAGELDRVVPPSQALRLADTIWADYDLVLGVGHSLPTVTPGRAGEVIGRVLDIAYHADIGRLRETVDESLGELGEPL